jgi:hopene-associated glycosyltransferase HpnB
MIVFLAFCVWLYLFFFHGRFWESGPELQPAMPAQLPAVDIVVPARDEAETIGRVVESLVAQDYPGVFRVFVVDDGSTDATAAIAAASGAAVVTAAAKPAGWSGKLWALAQGVLQTLAPVLLFADADIVHDRRHLSALVARLVSPRVDMVSEMVRLNCTSLAERALVPAFIYFFQMLYPFALVNDPLRRVAAAAGGTVLIRREALERIGGIAAIKSALIDDVALGRAVKAGGPIYLGHSGLADSIRQYPEFADIFRMISRTAFTQLRYSAAVLVVTMLGLSLVWLVPVWAVLFGHGWRFLFGLTASALAVASYMPTLARYRVSRLWALALPAIALFYMAATLSSARDYWRGTGARWKSRDYGNAR